ncbi:HEAT repeat [Streptomyces sp. WMMB 714]|uniref:HEAT repeat domain-containing protein n=1 Tax=Streptomyces sp. WMMB 714 TaxID=1286822 RepID=UPI0006988DF2|nr:HEAT repeat domain-containing protein [Streptomyces sp. WMMB 714]SCK24400.1 HEAT repeat [Streptomyces sp. WMMB 714]
MTYEPTEPGPGSARELVPQQPARELVPQPGAPAREWVDYDLAARRTHYWSALSGTAPALPPAPAEALCHGDGRVREAALRRAVPGALLPLVVLRCADWAEPVRDAARAVLAAASDESLVAAADTVLGTSARRYGGFALELLETRLAGGRLALWRRMFSDTSRRVRRWAYRRAADTGRLTAAEFAEAACRDTDVIVQETCASAALASDPLPETVHDRLLTSRSPRVRAAAVTALRRSGRQCRAVPLLADRTAAVRACAQWAVRTAGGEPAPYYRAALTHAAEAPPGAVAGLGECGVAADAALLGPLLGDPRSGVRAAAAGALDRLGAADPARLSEMLDDPSPAVVRRVAAALEPDAHTLPAGELLARLAPGHPAHVRRAALRLVQAGRPELEQLRAALPLVDDEDAALRGAARMLTARWSPPDAAKLCAALPPSERALLSAELDRASLSLHPGTVRMLRLMLRL